jgi:ABC-type uncharacterized transport system substrate-binding protein
MADFGAQQPAMPVIGFLDSRSSDAMGSRLGGFRQGLKELGFAEGENVAVAYPWAEDRLDRLPEMAAELVSRQPPVIVTTGGPTTALAAKAATTTIPIVFLVPSIGDAYRQWAVYAARIRSSLPASENLHKSRHSDRCLGHAAWRQVL